MSGVVERVLQNTFGIERNVNENVFKSRVNQSSTLVQHRNDGSKYPVLSLESAYCKGGFDDANIIVPSELAFESPVLLVGLSRSYRTAYTQADLCEMARMYWKLDKFKNTTLPALLQSEAAVLAGWTSEFGGPRSWVFGASRKEALSVAERNRYDTSVKSKLIFLCGKSSSEADCRASATAMKGRISICPMAPASLSNIRLCL